MARHTPGPWHYEITGLGYIIKGTFHGMLARVATVHGMSACDAMLIAQAPRLLEALKRARNELAGSLAESLPIAALVAEIDAAIHDSEHPSHKP